MALLMLPWGVVVVLGAALQAQGAGFVAFESTGFLRKAAVQGQGDSSTALRLGPRLTFEGERLEGKVDFEAAMYLTSAAMPDQAGAKLAASSLTFDSRDTYLATASGSLGGHQLTLGRRHFEWSRADEDWRLGLWSPRSLWDPVHTETLGLTGLFYGYHSGRFYVSAFASPLNVPEHGAPVVEENGELHSASRDFSMPYGGAIVMNQVVDIHYRVSRPALRELVLQPATAVRVGYDSGDQGAFSSISVGQLPISSLDVIAQARLASGSQYIDATLRPRVRTHQVATLEGGYRLQGGAQVWASSSWERPLDAEPLAGDWMSDPMGPAWIFASGANFKATRHLTLEASQVWVTETKPAPSPTELNLDLPSRFSFVQAFRLGAKYTLGPRWRTETTWIRDVTSRGYQVSAALGYGSLETESAPWRANFGADLFWGDFSDAGVGRYVGNDRIWGKLTYAF